MKPPLDYLKLMHWLVTGSARSTSCRTTLRARLPNGWPASTTASNGSIPSSTAMDGRVGCCSILCLSASVIRLRSFSRATERDTSRRCARPMAATSGRWVNYWRVRSPTICTDSSCPPSRGRSLPRPPREPGGQGQRLLYDRPSRNAANRGRLRAQKSPSGAWLSSKNWVDEYAKAKFKAIAVIPPALKPGGGQVRHALRFRAACRPGSDPRRLLVVGREHRHHHNPGLELELDS